MSKNPLQIAQAKERQSKNYDRKNPLMKIITMMNQYHSIDKMYASKEEKDWAKDRLKSEITHILKFHSSDIHGRIKASFHSIEIWEETREYLS